MTTVTCATNAWSSCLARICTTCAKGEGYQRLRVSFKKAHPVGNCIGARKAPRLDGRAGFMRIDSVRHESDLSHHRHGQHFTLPSRALCAPSTKKRVNPQLNLHRPCMFVTYKVNAKDKVVKVYKHEDVTTSLEVLGLHYKQGLVKFKIKTMRMVVLTQAKTAKQTLLWQRKCSKSSTNYLPVLRNKNDSLM